VLRTHRDDQGADDRSAAGGRVVGYGARVSVAGEVAAPARADRRSWAVPALAVAASAALILGPLLGPGYVLTYDMVFAPHMPLDAASVGLGSQLPRAVPSDLVVALATRVLPGDVVQKLVLVALVVGAGLGAARLADVMTEPAALTRTAAALAYIWTPYLGERLLLGQWAVLVGYALLPWLVLAARRARRARGPDRAQAWARFVLVLGLMCLGGAPAWLLAVLTAPAVLAVPAVVPGRAPGRAPSRAPGRAPSRDVRAAAVRVLGCLVVLAVFALPWAIPALARPGGVRADPAGAQAFAPAADLPFGLVASLLTGGGIWNADTVPPGRDAVVPALGALLLLGLGVAGAVRCRRDVAVPLAVAGLAGLLIALVTGWPAGARALARVPGLALLRDSQRLLAPWVLLLAVGFAAALARLAGALGRRAGPAALLLAVLPVAVLPTLAWGVSGKLAAVDYPADFGRVRDLVSADPRPGAVLVLPYTAYRRFGWNSDRTVMDPVPRWLGRTVIVNSDLPVAVAGDRVVVVRGEDRLASRLAADVRAAGAGDRSLARSAGRAGVRWVVVDAAVDPSLLAGLTLRHDGSDVRLYEVPSPWVGAAANDPTRGTTAPSAAVVAGDVVATGVLVAAGLWTAVRRSTRR
jgi:hypothetical protein